MIRFISIIAIFFHAFHADVYAADLADCPPVVSEDHSLDLIGQLIQKMQVCPDKNAALLEQAAEFYKNEFLSGQPQLEKTFNGLSLRGTKEELAIFPQILGVRSPSVWPDIASGCTTILCATAKLFKSEEAAMRVLAQAKYSGYTITVDQYNTVPKKDEQIWSLDEIRVIDTAIRKLPQNFLRLSTLKTLQRMPDGYYAEEKHKKEDTAAYASNFSKLVMFYGRWVLSPEFQEEIVIHELAHHFDFSNRKGNQDYNENSEFRNLSKWESVSVRGSDGRFSVEWYPQNPKKFVREYAGTNPLEDFAEAVAYYVTEPNTLRDTDPEKFAFIKKNIFAGREYSQNWKPLDKTLTNDLVSNLVSKCISSLEPFLYESTPGNFSLWIKHGEKMGFPLQYGLPDAILDKCISEPIYQPLLVKLASEPDFCLQGGSSNVRKKVKKTMDQQLKPAYEELASFMNGEGRGAAAVNCMRAKDLRATCLLKEGTGVLTHPLNSSAQTLQSFSFFTDAEMQKILNPYLHRGDLIAACVRGYQNPDHNYVSADFGYNSTCNKALINEMSKDQFKFDKQNMPKLTRSQTLHEWNAIVDGMQDIISTSLFRTSEQCLGTKDKKQCQKNKVKDLIKQWCLKNTIDSCDALANDRFVDDISQIFQ